MRKEPEVAAGRTLEAGALRALTGLMNGLFIHSRAEQSSDGDVC